MNDEPNRSASTGNQATGTPGELILGVVTLTVLSFVVIAGLIIGFNALASSGGSGFGECKSRTRAMLLDPSSASFGAPSRATSTRNPKIFRYLYKVTASNAYGGKIEKVFNCIVDDSGPTRTFQIIGG